jgi:hypothetical protein
MKMRIAPNDSFSRTDWLIDFNDLDIVKFDSSIPDSDYWRVMAGCRFTSVENDTVEAESLASIWHV